MVLIQLTATQCKKIFFDEIKLPVALTLGGRLIYYISVGCWCLLETFSAAFFQAFLTQDGDGLRFNCDNCLVDKYIILIMQWGAGASILFTCAYFIFEGR